jgi:uncharacterized membrane protein HdeD (DUF308 family)
LLAGGALEAHMTSTHASDLAGPHRPAARAGSLWAGVALMAIGAIALLFPFFSTLGATLAVGAMLAAAGIVTIIHAFSCRPAWRALLHALWGLANVAAGVGVVALPGLGAFTLTIVLAAMFLITGVARLAVALSPPQPRRWGLILFSGLLSIALSIYVMWMLPSAAFWLPGVVVGVDLIFAGAALIAMREARDRAAP